MTDRQKENVEAMRAFGWTIVVLTVLALVLRAYMLPPV